MDNVGDGAVKKIRIMSDKRYGYLRIEPLPSEEELTYFYKMRYYSLIKKGCRAPEIRKFLLGGKIAKYELQWLKVTLYQEINYTLKSILPLRNNKLLDIGCGRGDFMKFMTGSGWDVIGIEPSADAAEIAIKDKLKIYNLTLEKFLAQNQKDYENNFDAITLINILEHVINPKKILDIAKKLLKRKIGIICIKVPNDFNILQRYAEKKTGKKKWWITIPDHINYFNINSLQKFLENNGFYVVDKTVDFPMEIFLLMGEDYTNNQKVGNICHQKRVSFELSLPYPLRRELYRKLAEIGIGRDCIIYARMK